jgi:hypothetical protein
VSTIRARHAGSGLRGNRSPTSRTTGSMCSGTAARTRPAWPAPKAAACSSTGRYSTTGGSRRAHNGNLTNTAALAVHLIPQEPLPGWPAQPQATSDTDVTAELLAREADLSLEEAIVRTMPRLEALRPSATAQPPTFPLPNPEPEVAR